MSGVLFLAGPPSVTDVLEFAYAANHHHVMLPEFEHECLSLRRRTYKASERGTPRWSAIPTRLSVKEREPTPAHGEVPADFLESQRVLDGADHLPDNNARQSAEAQHDRRELLNTSLRLHEDEGSFVSETSRTEASFYEPNAQMQAIARLSITNLDAIPSAVYLKSITPQTMTVTLLVGIMSDPTYRTIRSTRSNQNLTLFEFVAGDHTRTGFGINIWLGPDGGVNSPLYAETLKARRGRVLLLRNIALNSFRDRVYGQNLYRDLTSIEAVHPGCHGDRIDLVRDWVAEHVVWDSFLSKGEVRMNRLPPDTQ